MPTGQAQVDQRPSQILDEMERQQKHLEMIETVSADFLNRIIPILRDPEPADPDAAKKEIKEIEPLAPLAEKIRENNGRIMSVVRDLKSAIDRFEL